MKALDINKTHNDILNFLNQEKDTEIKDYFDFPNKYGNNVSTFCIKYDIEDAFNYSVKDITIDYSSSVVFIRNVGYFSFKTITDIKNIINKKSK